ncbi:hypothetical protein [Rugosimonospora africana]
MPYRAPNRARHVMSLAAACVLATALMVVARPASAAPAAPPPAATPGTAARPAPPLPAPRGHRLAAPPHANVVRVCPPPKPGYAACQALRLDIPPVQGATPNGIVDEGWAPADLQAAYNLPSAYQGDGQTVAVVEDGDSPTAESDLATYRSFYGLPPCTTANGCFRKVNQEGKASPLPSQAVPDWAGESALDVDMVSAICPRCHILLVETDDQLDIDLAEGAYIATTLGAKFVSNSYGFPEEPGTDASLDAFYRQDGVVMTASTGDDGYGVSYPAASPNVISVGGTSLLKSTNARGWDEITWTLGGSGCSLYGAKPPWQHDTGCANRTTADVSAVADPYTGVSVRYPGGWGIFGGTSVSAPIVAAAYALAGAPPSSTSHPAQYPYLHPTMLNDVVGGTNSLGGCGTGNLAYLCTAGYGYDGPTGLGTPNGVGAFRAPGWSTVPGLIDGNANISVVASTAVSASTSYLFTVVPGSGVWMRRSVNGIWASSATKVDSTTAISYIAAATDATGAVHLLMSEPNNGVWERVYRNGTWSAAAQVDTNPSIGPIAATTDLAGAVDLFMTVPSSGVWTRTLTGTTWSGSTHLDTNGAITNLSAVCDITGAVHLFMTVPASGVWTRTLTGTTWSGSTHLDTNTTVTVTAAVRSTDGIVHLLTKRSNGVYDRLMHGSSSWDSTAVLADPNANVTSVAATPDSNGIVHLISRVAGIGVYDRVANPQ